ncbi:MAG: Gfo/Idh/MocA family oxidoreductase [Phycisphaerales bacterium]|jgi:predicted dehydrogenase|nr:Gfo/Idh/MocA family oxidoreductase [Phycisphaerales bacterium]
MNKIRIAVVGLGRRSTWAVESLVADPRYQVVALVDTIPAHSNVIARQFKLTDVPQFTRIEDCLESVDLHAVAIFTSDGHHAEVVIPALGAGKYVFVEKPLDITHEKLDAIIAADAKAGGRTFVGFNLRYAPVYEKIHELIQSGAIGDVLTIQADEFYDGGRTYFRRWNRLRSVGGGLWITKSSHDFDLLYWMAGAAPKSIFATASLSYYKPRPGAAMYCRDCQFNNPRDCQDRWIAEDQVPSILELVRATEQAIGQKPDLCLFNSDKDTFDNGIATVDFVNGVRATYTVNVVAGFTNRRMRVSGTRGTLDGDLENATLTLTGRDPTRIEQFNLKAEGGHGGADGFVLSNFANFVAGQPAKIVPPKEAAVAVRMGLAATQSSDTGQVVSMAERV